MEEWSQYLWKYILTAFFFTHTNERYLEHWPHGVRELALKEDLFNCLSSWAQKLYLLISCHLWPSMLSSVKIIPMRSYHIEILIFSDTFNFPFFMLLFIEILWRRLVHGVHCRSFVETNLGHCPPSPGGLFVLSSVNWPCNHWNSPPPQPLCPSWNVAQAPPRIESTVEDPSSLRFQRNSPGFCLDSCIKSKNI